MSGFLLDTNIPSETVKLRPDPRVTAWISAQPNAAVFISAITVGEIRRGFVTLPPSEVQRRKRLEQWLERDVMLWFDGRILPVTKEIADRWGVIDGTCQLRGTPANTADGLIAATALETRPHRGHAQCEGLRTFRAFRRSDLQSVGNGLAALGGGISRTAQPLRHGGDPARPGVAFRNS
jgi:predicted nucleic acid-binding protein